MTTLVAALLFVNLLIFTSKLWASQAGARGGPFSSERKPSATGNRSASAPASFWPVPRHWHPPKRWLPGALCIHRHEGAWNSNTGNGYFGGMQFLQSTWYRAGGRWHPAFSHSGDRRYPFTVTPREQLYRAFVIWRSHGGSWSEWGTRGLCGLR